MEDNGPSITASRVAAHRLVFSRVPAAYGDPAADDALAADVAAGREAPRNRMHDYLAARTSFFDRTVTGAIKRGVRQIVIGAAGYDGRALRYAKRGVHWFEVDHPATQHDKRERLDRLGLITSQVQFVPADFTRDPVAERLVEAGLDPGAPGLFLLEGIAVYLEPEVLETVLGQFREVAAPGSRLAISVSLSRDHDQASRARFQAQVAAMGEPAKSRFDAEEASELLARTGWRIMAGDDPGDAEADAKRERLRSAGLLTATAAPRTASAPDEPNASASRAQSRPAQSRPAARVVPADHHLSLSALLSQALVAFTIELDNEAERQLPHWTTDYGDTGNRDVNREGTWLVSWVMYENCMRFVGEDPITRGELRRLARTGTNLDGMRRWGYITIDGSARKGRPGPDSVLRATAKGLRARQLWRPLPGLIEGRWQDRYGSTEMDRLRDSLLSVAAGLDPGLPDCLPILGPDLVSRGPEPANPALGPRPGPAEPVDLTGLPLSALLSRVLFAFALDYERESALSLAVSANVLRVLDTGGKRPRDLPALTGTSKEAVRWAAGIVVRGGFAAEEPDPSASRGKIVRLAGKGGDAQRLYHELLGTIEGRWRERFGAGALESLRGALEPLATGPGDEPAPLLAAIEPQQENWRARVRPPGILPYYPMVLHRGGYPDGS